MRTPRAGVREVEGEEGPGGAMGRGEGTMGSTEKGKERREHGRKTSCLSYAEAVAMRVYLTSRTIMHSRYDSNREEKMVR